MCEKLGGKISLFLLMLLCVACASIAARAQSIWAVNDGEKVDRDDLSNPNKRANSVWDGHKVKIFGARNEIIAFQLIVEAGQDGIKQLRVGLPELRQRGGRSSIRYTPPAVDPTNYVGRPIQLF